MSEAVVDDIVAVLPPLLQSLEALGFVARYLNPPDFDRVMAGGRRAGRSLARRCGRGSRNGRRNSPTSGPRSKRPAMRRSPRSTALRVVQNGNGDFVSLFRALRYAPRAQEALYPLVGKIAAGEPVLRRARRCARTPISLARLAAPANDNTGIFHDHNEPGSRGGFSLYVPEYYTPDRAWPLVMALHGGSGNGRGFLWSWLRDARSHGAILVAPTATGNTWALMGDDTDTPNLMRILESVRSRWNIDAKRMLLTGMSDGGTFCYVSGLDGASPFTHLAPVSATFHPLMAEMADADRLRGLPDPYRARPARLDVSGAGGAADQPGAVGRGRQRHLSRDRRSQPHLSARDERA